MKITRRQLKRLIREERQLALREKPRERNLSIGMSKKKKKGVSDRSAQAFAGDPTWQELEGTPKGDAILDPSKRGQFPDIDNRRWTELEQIATAAGKSIKMNERITRRQLRRLINEEIRILEQGRTERVAQGSTRGVAVGDLKDLIKNLLAGPVHRYMESNPEEYERLRDRVIGIVRKHPGWAMQLHSGPIAGVLGDMQDRGEVEAIWKRTGGGPEGIDAIFDSLEQKLEYM